MDTLVDLVEIRQMDQCGWGLFARKVINKGTLLGLFTADIYVQDKKTWESTTKLNLNHCYSYSVSNSEICILDGTSCGNLVRFMQHAPKKEKLDLYEFDSSLEGEEIAVENVDVPIVILENGVQTYLFIASCKIEAGSLLGCDYELPYDDNWQPSLFKKNGEVIDRALYNLSPSALTESSLCKKPG